MADRESPFRLFHLTIGVYVHRDAPLPETFQEWIERAGFEVPNASATTLERVVEARYPLAGDVIDRLPLRMKRDAMNTITPCARCGERPAVPGERLCGGCAESGPLSAEEAARYRARLLEDDPAAELVVGETYNVRTTDGTVYRDAVLAGRSDGMLTLEVFGGLARVGVADHEFAGVE